MDNKTTLQQINEHYTDKILDNIVSAKLSAEDIDNLFKEWKEKLDNLKDIDVP